MKFSVLKNNLIIGLQNVIKAVPTTSTMPILSGILFSISDKSLTVMATDLETTITSSIPVMESEPGEVVLPARYIADIARRLPDEVVDFSIDVMTWKSTIKAGATRFQIYGQAPDDYPRIPEARSEITFNINGDLFSRMVTKTAFAAEIEEGKSYLSGVCLSIEDNHLTLVATNTFRLALNRGSITLKSQGDTSTSDLEVIVPARILSDVVRILPHDGGDVEVKVGEGFAIFRNSDTTVVTRLIDDKYLDYEKVIPTEWPIVIRVDGKALLSAAERAEVITRKTAIAKMLVGSGKIILSASASDVGELYEELDVREGNGEIEIGLDVNYLIDALKYLNADEVRVGFISPTKPISIRPEGDDTSLQIIMPVRLH